VIVEEGVAVAVSARNLKIKPNRNANCVFHGEMDNVIRVKRFRDDPSPDVIDQSILLFVRIPTKSVLA
jgi:hypothetical protein